MKEWVANQRFEKKYFSVESKLKILNNELISKHYEIIDNEGCTDPCTLRKEEEK